MYCSVCLICAKWKIKMSEYLVTSMFSVILKIKYVATGGQRFTSGLKSGLKTEEIKQYSHENDIS